MLRLVDYDSNEDDEDAENKHFEDNAESEQSGKPLSQFSVDEKSEHHSQFPVTEPAGIVTSTALSVCSAPDVVPIVSSFRFYMNTFG